LTILVVAALAAAFLLGIYFPGQKATAQVRAEIAEAEQAIRDVPRRLAELKSLQMEIDRRQAYLTRNGNLIPPDVHMHEVLSRVSQLARAASLSVTRLEPLPPVPLETCERRPFRLSFSGQFRDLMIFLHGL